MCISTSKKWQAVFSAACIFFADLAHTSPGQKNSGISVTTDKKLYILSSVSPQMRNGVTRKGG
jgi:hypothetical protein